MKRLSPIRIIAITIAYLAMIQTVQLTGMVGSTVRIDNKLSVPIKKLTLNNISASQKQATQTIKNIQRESHSNLTLIPSDAYELTLTINNKKDGTGDDRSYEKLFTSLIWPKIKSIEIYRDIQSGNLVFGTVYIYKDEQPGYPESFAKPFEMLKSGVLDLEIQLYNANVEISEINLTGADSTVTKGTPAQEEAIWKINAHSDNYPYTIEIITKDGKKLSGKIPFLSEDSDLLVIQAAKTGEIILKHDMESTAQESTIPLKLQE